MMNPYEILGVSESATEEQIKDAYRELARKYGDEAYSGGPLQDVAKQKMEELDRAYDTIVAERRGQEVPNYQNTSSSQNRTYTQNNTYATGGYADANGYTYTPSQFADVRQKIREGRMDDAETILDGIPRTSRTAEWYFLKGQIQQKRGWLDEAYKNFTTACQMDPGNKEYAQSYAAMHRNSSGGYRETRGGGCANPCDVCSSLLCADCCCECMGGDLIPGC